MTPRQLIRSDQSDTRRPCCGEVNVTYTEKLHSISLNTLPNQTPKKTILSYIEFSQEMAIQSFREIIGAQPSKVSTSSSVLIIIDAQNEYAEGHLKVHNVDASRKVISSLLQKYRSSSAPVIHVVHDTPSGAPIFTPSTPLAGEFSELAPKDGETVIHKQAPSSFTGTELDDVLKKLGKKQIVLVGYMAHVCITGTARSGM